MRLYFKNNHKNLYIDVPNRYLADITDLFDDYNALFYCKSGCTPLKILREEFNIFNYGKEEEN